MGELGYVRVIFWLVQCGLAVVLLYLSFKILLALYTLSPLYKGKVPFVPTKMVFIRKAFELLDIEPGDRVLDLGTGTGRFLKYAARRVKASFVGIELNGFLAICARWNTFFAQKKGCVHVIRGNYDDDKWDEYGKVFMFNMPSEIIRIIPKLENELKQGTLVASVMFPIPSAKFKKRKEFCQGKECLFLYERVD